MMRGKWSNDEDGDEHSDDGDDAGVVVSINVNGYGMSMAAKRKRDDERIERRMMKKERKIYRKKI